MSAEKKQKVDPAAAAAAGERYMARGVSASKEDVHAAIANVDKGLYPKAFCKIVPDIAGDPEWCTIMHADGAGTKTSLAYMYWKETGDLSVWRGIAQDSVIMNTDDLLCIGCVDNILLSSTIGRNKSKVRPPTPISVPARPLTPKPAQIPGEVLTALIGGTESVLQTLRESQRPRCAAAAALQLAGGLVVVAAVVAVAVAAGGAERACSLPSRGLSLAPDAGDSGVGIISTGGETADLGDLVRTVVVDSTVTARMPRKDVISNDNIRAGDVVRLRKQPGAVTSRPNRITLQWHPPTAHRPCTGGRAGLLRSGDVRDRV